MRILLQPLGGNNHHLSPLFVLVLHHKRLFTKTNLVSLLCRHHVWHARILHLTDVHNAIHPVYHHINLHPWVALFASPRIEFRVDAAHAQGTRYLAEVEHAYLLKRQPIERILLRVVQHVAPQMLIRCPALAETMVEHRVEVHQLIDAAILSSAVVVHSKEIATHKILQLIAKVPIVSHIQGLNQFRASHTLLLRCQHLDNRHIILRILVHRTVQSPVLLLQFRIVREEHQVHILSHTQVQIQQTQVIRYATYRAVHLQNRQPVPPALARTDILLSCGKVERMQMDVVRQTLM